MKRSTGAMVLLAALSGCVSQEPSAGGQYMSRAFDHGNMGCMSGNTCTAPTVPGFQGPAGQPVAVAAPYNVNPPGGADLARSMVRQSVPLELVQQTGFAPDGNSGIIQAQGFGQTGGTPRPGNPGFGQMGGTPPGNPGFGQMGGTPPGNPGFGQVGGTPPGNPGFGQVGGTPPGNPGFGQVGGTPPGNPGFGQMGGMPPGNPGFGQIGGTPPGNPGFGQIGGTPPGNSGFGQYGGNPSALPGPGAPGYGQLGGNPPSLMPPGLQGPGAPGMPGPGLMGPGSYGMSGPCMMGPAGAVAAVGALTGASSPYPAQRTEVRFTGPNGMRVAWFAPTPDGRAGFGKQYLEAPGRYNFLQAAIYRLKLSDIPNRPGIELYPTLEVVPGNAKTSTFLAHSAVPVTFTEEDFNQVASGNYLVKVVYLPDPQFQDLAATGTDEVISSRLEPGVDPIAEAHRRGSILLIVRLGNIDLEAPNTPAMDAPSAYTPHPAPAPGAPSRLMAPPLMPPVPGATAAPGAFLPKPVGTALPTPAPTGPPILGPSSKATPAGSTVPAQFTPPSVPGMMLPDAGGLSK